MSSFRSIVVFYFSTINPMIRNVKAKSNFKEREWENPMKFDLKMSYSNRYESY